MPTNISLVACLFNTNGKNLFGLLPTLSACRLTDRATKILKPTFRHVYLTFITCFDQWRKIECKIIYAHLLLKGKTKARDDNNFKLMS